MLSSRLFPSFLVAAVLALLLLVAAALRHEHREEKASARRGFPPSPGLVEEPETGRSHPALRLLLA